MAVGLTEREDAQSARDVNLSEKRVRVLRAHSTAFRPIFWAAAPLLAVVAYATVLRIGFLSDDFVLLLNSEKLGFSLQRLTPTPYALFYRPVGILFTWDSGLNLWGYNPFPYHLEGLIVHALTVLILGLWVYEATSNETLGLLASVLFAVFPLNSEAVGWLAAQWDALAALFMTRSRMSISTSV